MCVYIYIYIRVYIYIHIYICICVYNQGFVEIEVGEIIVKSPSKGRLYNKRVQQTSTAGSFPGLPKELRKKFPIIRTITITIIVIIY